MKGTLRHIGAVALGVFLLFGCDTSNRKASKLYDEASRHIKMGQEAEKSSYQDALHHYQEAQAGIETITSQYLHSDIAKRLDQGGTIANTYTPAELKENLIPQTRLKATAEKDPFECALLISQSIVLKQQEVSALVNIAGMYLEAGKKDKALDTFSRATQEAAAIKDVLEQEKAYAEIALHFSMAGHFDRAIETASKVDDHYFSAELLAQIADLYTKAGQPDRASDMLSKALKVTKKIEAGYHRFSLLEMIAVFYANAGQFKKSIDTAGTITWANQKDRALVEIASMLAGAGRFDEAFDVIRPIEDLSSHAEALSKIAVARAERGDFKKALKGAANIGDTYRKSNTMAEIAARYVEAEKNEKALEILSISLASAREIQIADFKCDALGKISVTYIKTGQPEKALEVAKKIGDTYSTSNALSQIAVYYADAGQKDKAENLFTRATGAAKNMGYTLAIIAGRCAEAGLFDKALETAGSIENEIFRIKALEEIIDQLASGGKKKNTSDVLLQALDIAGSTAQAADRAAALAVAGSGYSRTGTGIDPKAQKALHKIISELD